MRSLCLALIFILCTGIGRAATSPTPQPLSIGPRQGVPVSNDLLYVSNAGNNSIAIYRHDASGNTPPIAVIAGPRTGLNLPGQLSEDSQGNLYVFNRDSFDLLVFAHGITGNVAPSRVLTPRSAFLDGIVDPLTNKIFVMTPYSYGGGYSDIERFPPGATGNEPPFAASGYDFPPPIQLANDSTGNNLIELHSGTCCSYSNIGIDTIVKQFPNGHDPATVYQVTNLLTFGIADDAATHSYLVSTDFGIARLAENTIGNGPDGPKGQRIPVHLKPTPISTISSATNCGQLVLGYLRNIYAVCGSAIEVFAPTASGNAAPLRVLSGPRTGLNSPVGIFEGK